MCGKYEKNFRSPVTTAKDQIISYKYMMDMIFLAFLKFWRISLFFLCYFVVNNWNETIVLPPSQNKSSPVFVPSSVNVLLQNSYLVVLRDEMFESVVIWTYLQLFHQRPWFKPQTGQKMTFVRQLKVELQNVYSTWMSSVSYGFMNIQLDTDWFAFSR